MDVGARVEIALETQRRRARAHVADGRLSRLLHDVAQLTGQDQLALAGHDGHLGDQQIASVGGHRQPVGHPDLIAVRLPSLAKVGRAQVLGQALGRDLPRRDVSIT